MSKGWLLVMAIIVVPVYFLVARFADDGKTLVASCSAGMIVVVGYFWDLRKRVVLDYGDFHCVSSRSFRGVASPAGQAMEYVHRNYVQMLPFGLLDFAIAYGIIRLVENVAKRSS